MSERVYLGIDLGAESGRVMAGRFDGTRLQLDELHRFANGPTNIAGTLRWNLVGLWKEILIGLTKAAERYGDSIVSVGVDTWGVDYVLLSKTNEVLGVPYNYRDPRTEGMMNAAFSRVPKAEIFAQSGLQFMEINSLYQLLAMQKEQPDVLALADKFLMIPDYFHWLLCGSRVVEFTNATTSQCFHPTENNWAYDMLNKFELPTEIFPEVVTPGTQLGTLRDCIMKETGLGKIPIVTPPTHDTAAAVAAVPTEHTGNANWAYISSGTWSLIGVEVQDAILTDAALKMNVTNEGGVDGTYRLLKNVMGLWLVQGCKRAYEKQGRVYDYTELTMLAEEAEPFRSLVDPNDHPFLHPNDMTIALQEWCKDHSQPVPETPGQLVRCALESLALKYRNVLEGIQELTGETVEVIHIVGGGSNSDLLNQFTANACGVPVITGPVEATVMGNLLIQARTAGEVESLSEIRKIVRQSTESRRFEPQNSSDWQTAYERFCQLLK
ncbi:rhamnulokinase family protein [Rubinisphaera sp.]|uniref:rhamnulokinase n=1 Tax=Rubinisphaera sp. TaxID=2024857 RepID=UPI000C0D130C|nr:rhamnulokinase family protein [Rubinisphaera sp.]MBV08913.1 rhamnulokinase [Rubinisphaera sp.]HCS55030.1 rhamnulokinase [Planctomycetaceae bacterium]|tara:strand:+ start:39 stop:1523 length:1485 start_codon:yes stop_codon:yes gene_type:complete